MKSERIRAGLYRVTNDYGHTCTIENRQSPADWGSQWLWYIDDNERANWIDPVLTKREAMHIAAFL